MTLRTQIKHGSDVQQAEQCQMIFVYIFFLMARYAHLHHCLVKWYRHWQEAILYQYISHFRHFGQHRPSGGPGTYHSPEHLHQPGVLWQLCEWIHVLCGLRTWRNRYLSSKLAYMPLWWGMHRQCSPCSLLTATDYALETKYIAQYSRLSI